MAVSENLSVHKENTENNAHIGNNENPLSEREMDVARLLATGASNGEIARDLAISPHTVKVHIRNIFEKVDANSRTEASMVLVQRGWLTIPGIDAPKDTTSSAAQAHVDTKAVLVPASAQALPEPQPLFHQESSPSTWQRVYLLIGFAATIFSFFTANLFSNGLPAPDIFTDRGRPVIGGPPIMDEPRWMFRPRLFEPRSRMAIAQVGDKVYVIGGESLGGESIDNVEMYDLAANEWIVTASLPQPQANAAAAALNNRIYVAGGNHFPDPDDNTQPEISNALWQLVTTPDGNTPAGTWTQIGTLPAQLTGGAMITAENALYLIGGWDGENMRSEIWRLVPPKGVDDVLPAWDLVNRMESPRAFFGTVYFNEKIYIVGGHNGQRELARADAYDPKTGAWTPLPSLGTPRGGLSLATDNRSIYAFGGGWGEPVTTHERFDPNTNFWSNFPSPIPGEWRHMATFSYESNLYLIGGWSGDYLDVHLQYENLFRRMLLPLIQTD